ncbi:MAG TPA: hypothetical protein PKY77_10840 [Phycisphaerae bacterium]|nr:hypothetical protein [Phycisphaerae bacterium]HRY70076.1 hypothetical protein [Phycisphaerae bacterium]HSA27352.1 hypothetical protein [Phycisphaerae bacterium]
MAISVADPIGRVIKRARYITFQPLDLGKWVRLGFAAFPDESSEGGGGFGGGGGHGGRGAYGGGGGGRGGYGGGGHRY